MDLVDYIRRHSSEKRPIETGQDPHLPEIPGIKAVVFDIYGTIMISAAGDIGLAGGGNCPKKAMAQALETVHVSTDPAAALKCYNHLINQQQQQSNVEFPEVEIRDVWVELLSKLEGDITLASQACVAYECASNPVWPMPGLHSCIEDIRARNLHLGIVSNAQFYTPLLFPALTGKTLESFGFQEHSMVFSYQMKEGKPSQKLYQKLRDQLTVESIYPSNVLYIGNDLLKDIWPAQKTGFRTALFAGDQRSLRWHKGDIRLADVRPDAVITELSQIIALLP